MGMTVAVATDGATLNAIGLLCGGLGPELKWLLTFQRKPYHPRQGSWLVQVKPVNFKGLFVDRVAQLEVVLCMYAPLGLWSFARVAEDRGEDRGDRQATRAGEWAWPVGWLAGWSEERGGVGRGWMRIALSRRVELAPARFSTLWTSKPDLGRNAGGGLDSGSASLPYANGKRRPATLGCF